MTSRGLLFALLLAAPARGQSATELAAEARRVGRTPPPREARCVAFRAQGCYLVPEAGVTGEAALLVYYRGWWRGHGNGSVPAGERVESARQALSFYGLEAAAARVGAVLFVTGSSDQAFAEEDVAALEKETGFRFATVSLAAHSGGYAGLFKSLPGLRRPERVVMLDNFYFTDAAKAAALQKLVDAGTVCAGFYTAHNEDRWREGFRGRVTCSVEAQDKLGHEGGVNACLAAYLTKTSCP